MPSQDSSQDSGQDSGQVSENKPQTNDSRRFLQHALKRLATAAVGAAFLGLAVAGVAALHARSAAETLPRPHPPVSVQTFKLELEPSYRETVRYVGQLEPARQTALAFERPGLVTEVHKDEGDRVAAGDVVATLDVSQLEASRRQLEAQIRELQARRDLAELTLDRQSKLQKKGWSPEQRLDEAEATLDELSAAIDRVRAQVASIDIDIDKSQLKAPFDGVIGSRGTDEGAVVAARTPILTVLEADHRQVRIGLPPDVAARLDPAKVYRVETSAGFAEARLFASRPDLQGATRTVTALFDVPSENNTPSGVSPLGEIVTLVLESEIKTRGAWVPLVALKESDRGLWSVLTVTQQDGQQVVQREAAEVLHVDGEFAYVRGTFEPGAAIISNGTNCVVAGQRVAVAGS